MQQPDLISDDLQLTDSVFSYLKEISRWSRFLAVMGFVVVGMMIVGAFALPAIVSSYNYSELDGALKSDYKTGMTVNFLILAVLLFFPCLFLFRFSIKMREALANGSQQSFEDSFRNLKSTFKFYGILTIIILGIYALAFVGFLVAAIFSP